MVICKFYQQGNCRFGTKCANEHFDLKQLIKNEVEAALKGSQWPLSCFGPFKEKTCIPNFIEDQSFEEARYFCMSSNNSIQFQQRFNAQIIESQNKMKNLLLLSREIMDIVTQIYDSGEQKSIVAGGGSTVTSSNPFATMSATMGATNDQQNSGNIFGANPMQQTNSAGRIFGGTSIVGQSAFNNSPQINNFFNQQLTATGFGQQSSNFTGTNSIFPSSSVGSTVNGAISNNGSIFAAQQQQQQQQQPSNSIFAGNSGGNSAMANSGFVNSNTGNNNIFNQTTTQLNSGNIFIPSPNQIQPNTFTSFLQSSQTNPASNTGGIFNQQPRIQQTQNIFSLQQQTGQSMQEDQATQNINSVIQSIPDVNQGGIFTTQPNVLNLSSNISNQQQQQNVGNFQTANIFQNQQQALQNPVGTTFNINNNNINSKIYSRLEDLSAEQLEAFKAPRFILPPPTLPPPRELC